MNIYLDIKADYAAQVIDALKSLNQDYFNSIQVEQSAEFIENKKDLSKILSLINSNQETLIDESSFWGKVEKSIN